MQTENKTVYIEKLKSKGGTHSYILPRQSGKSTSLINAVGPGDLFLSPIEVQYFINIITKACGMGRAGGYFFTYRSSNKVVTYDNRRFISPGRRSIDRYGYGCPYRNVYIDEFLLFDARSLNEFLTIFAHKVKNSIIMLSSIIGQTDQDQILELPLVPGYASAAKAGSKPIISMAEKHYII